MATNRWLISCHLIFTSDYENRFEVTAAFELATAVKEALTWQEVNGAVEHFGLTDAPNALRRQQDVGATPMALVSATAIAVSPLARAHEEALASVAVPEPVSDVDTAKEFETQGQSGDEG